MKAARQMTSMLTKKNGEPRRYPKTLEVLKAADLHTIAHYMQVRRKSIMQWIINRPIFKMV